MNKQAEQAANGVALLGLAIIFLLNFFWPGIFFVGAAHAVTKGVLANRPKEFSNASWLIALGIAFALPGELFLPGLLAAIGIGSLFSALVGRGRSSEEEQQEMEKRKNEEILREEKAKRGSRVVLGDDGELIEISEDEEEVIRRQMR